MAGAVFFETLRQTWVQTVIWGIILGLLGVFIIVIIPDADVLQQFVELMEALPEFLVRAIGATDDLNFMATPDGFVAVGFFGKTLLLMAAFPVIMGMRVTVSEENDGTMDMLLSMPVPRWRVIVEKFVAYSLMIVLIAVFLFIGLGGGTALSGVDLSIDRMALAVFNIIPSMILILAFTLFIGVLTHNRRLVLGLATAFVLGSLMLDTIGLMAGGSFAEALRSVSFFKYYDSTSVIQNGLTLSNVLLLTSTSLVLLISSVQLFQRRDVAV